MRQLDPEPGSGGSRSAGQFILYLEGPADRGILRAWSYRLLPTLGRHLFGRSVILGGRRPARALDHFRGEVQRRPALRALCVLDRDDERGEPPAGAAGLEFFTWSRRHIESYLLVLEALRRVLGAGERGDRVERVLREHLPPAGDEGAHRELDAKRLLGPRGPLARALGRPIPLARIARATRESELHPDVHVLFGCLRRSLGVADALELPEPRPWTPQRR